MQALAEHSLSASRAERPTRFSRSPLAPMTIGFWPSRSTQMAASTVELAVLLGQALDLHRDAVGQLLIELQGQLLADHLARCGITSRSVSCPVREQRRATCGRCAAMVRRRASMASLLQRRDRHDARNSWRVRQLRQIRQQPLARMHLVDLVDRRPSPGAGAHDALEHQVVLVGPAAAPRRRTRTRSASSSAVAAVRFMALLSARSASWCRPGVSTKAICASASVQIPSIRWRVVCGRGVTMLSFWPTRALSSVDLPTFGRPTSAAKPQRNQAGSGVLKIGPLPSACESPPACARRPPARRAGGSSPALAAAAPAPAHRS